MRKKILIIEDETALCSVLTLRFQKNGFDVVIANDGADGLTKVRREKPDLVILDLMLPGLPGEEVCKEIRKDLVIYETPIIMLTAKSQQADTIIGKVIGADAYITKPFDAQNLLAQVNRLTQKD